MMAPLPSFCSGTFVHLSFSIMIQSWCLMTDLWAFGRRSPLAPTEPHRDGHLPRHNLVSIVITEAAFALVRIPLVLRAPFSPTDWFLDTLSIGIGWWGSSKSVTCHLIDIRLTRAKDKPRRTDIKGTSFTGGTHIRWKQSYLKMLGVTVGHPCPEMLSCVHTYLYTCIFVYFCSLQKSCLFHLQSKHHRVLSDSTPSVCMTFQPIPYLCDLCLGSTHSDTMNLP
jgi:hypothetical protein